MRETRGGKKKRDVKKKVMGECDIGDYHIKKTRPVGISRQGHDTILLWSCEGVVENIVWCI